MLKEEAIREQFISLFSKYLEDNKIQGFEHVDDSGWKYEREIFPGTIVKKEVIILEEGEIRSSGEISEKFVQVLFRTAVNGSCFEWEDCFRLDHFETGIFHRNFLTFLKQL